MKINLDVLTTPSVDTPGTTLMLTIHDSKYVFGQIGEGSQRAWLENGVRMSKISKLFLTGQINWKNTGGLLGVILTLADVVGTRRRMLQEIRKRKAEEMKERGGDNGQVSTSTGTSQDDAISVHGGANLMSLVATGRTFIYRENFPLTIDEIQLDTRSPTVYQDKNVTVHAIEVLPDESKRKRPLDQVQNEQYGAGKAEDLQNLQQILSGMFNLKPGSLNVNGDDVDYLSALESRLKEDAQRIKLMQEDEPEKDREPSYVDLCPPESPTKKSKNNEGNAISTARPLRRPWPAATVPTLPATSESRSSISYIVSMPPRRGKFDRKKALELGVKPGPDFSLLVAGESITTKDGKVVTGKDCIEPDVPTPSVAILDIPSADYIDDTLKGIKNWLGSNSERVISSYVWILGENVEKEDSLQSFFQEKHDFKHIVSSPTACEDLIPFKGSAEQLTNLNYVNAAHFPLPLERNQHRSSVVATSDAPFLTAKAMGSLEIVPKQSWSTAESRTKFDFETILRKIDEPHGKQLVKEVALIGKQARLLEAKGDRPLLPGADVEVVTLGTGSSVPSKYRNVSANLIKVPEVGNFLLDAGENTLGQIRRMYDAKESDKLLQDLRCIYISHIHADHHLGTVAVIKAWHEQNEKNLGANSQKLYLVVPSQYKQWLWEYSRIEAYGYKDLNILSCEDFLHSRDGATQVQDRVQRCCSDLSLEAFETSYAIHCLASYTVALTFNNGFKVAYSGDTRPTSGFVKIGKDCTLLIHEATFDDELRAEAVQKKHSTTSDAITTGNQMNAKCLLLTHFSQRYPKLPVIETAKSAEAKEAEKIVAEALDGADPTDDNSSTNSPFLPPKFTPAVASADMKIGLAFDMLHVKIRDFWRLETLMPALRELFKHDIIEVGYAGKENSDAESATGSTRDANQESKSSAKKILRKQQKNKKANIKAEIDAAKEEQPKDGKAKKKLEQNLA